MSEKLTRREWATIAGSACVAGWSGFKIPVQKYVLQDKGSNAKSPVAIVKAPSYSTELAARILEGVRACGLDVKGKRIVLKPNMVEFNKANAINTNVAVVAAALDVVDLLDGTSVTGHIVQQVPGQYVIIRQDGRDVTLMWVTIRRITVAARRVNMPKITGALPNAGFLAEGA